MMAETQQIVRRLGISIAFFGMGGLLSSIVLWILIGRGTVDLLQILAIWNGIAITKGGERALYWGSILTGLYAFVTTALTIAFMSGLGIDALGKPGTTIQDNPWLFPILVLLCTWTTINFFGCIYVRRRLRRMQRGQCPACAYPVGTSPVCTECGGPVKPSAISSQQSAESQS